MNFKPKLFGNVQVAKLCPIVLHDQILYLTVLFQLNMFVEKYLIEVVLSKKFLVEKPLCIT